MRQTLDICLLLYSTYLVRHKKISTLSQLFIQKYLLKTLQAVVLYIYLVRRHYLF
jgi:hypothetical protein